VIVETRAARHVGDTDGQANGMSENGERRDDACP
jgi:hypothetical protein